jgi:putative membrane protein
VRFKSTTAILFMTTMAFAAYAGDADRPMQVAMGGNDTQKFFEQAASANKFEVEVGRLAAQKASNPQLKAFGQQMVTDHTKASQELQSLASRKGVTLPNTMTDADQKKLDKLRQEKPGKDFDQKFRDVMIDSHQDAVSLFEDTSKSSDDPEVKNFAAKMLPTLQHHEQQAKALPKV